MPRGNTASAIGFSINGDKFYELIIHGLHNDVQQLSELGSQFATRQRNRHLIGHEACPDWEGRCWKGIRDMDPDPLHVCPQSPAGQALTPCYRIVDEVRAKIKQFEDATACDTLHKVLELSGKVCNGFHKHRLYHSNFLYTQM